MAEKPTFNIGNKPDQPGQPNTQPGNQPDPKVANQPANATIVQNPNTPAVIPTNEGAPIEVTDDPVLNTDRVPDPLNRANQDQQGHPIRTDATGKEHLTFEERTQQARLRGQAQTDSETRSEAEQNQIRQDQALSDWKNIQRQDHSIRTGVSGPRPGVPLSRIDVTNNLATAPGVKMDQSKLIFFYCSHANFGFLNDKGSKSFVKNHFLITDNLALADFFRKNYMDKPNASIVIQEVDRDYYDKFNTIPAFNPDIEPLPGPSGESDLVDVGNIPVNTL